MTTNAATGSRPRAGLKEWIALAVLALPAMLVSIDVSVMILALPHIGVSLGADSAQQLWIMDIYGFMLAGFMITMGTLGDRIGRRKLLMIGAAAFGIASTLAAFSPSTEMLIAARALLGIAGATMSPSILALITNMFRDPGQRAFAISVWMVSFMGGMTVGPLVGGILLEHFWWGSVFLLGVPAMMLLLTAAPFLLPEYRDPKAGRLDLLSVAISLCAILPVIYGLKEIAKQGFQTLPILALLVGLAFGLVFVLRQRRLADPLFDLRLFANREVSTAVACMFGVTATGAIMLFNSQYLQLVLGMSALQAGLWTLPGVMAGVVMLMLSPVIAKRVRPAPFMALGLVVSAAGAFMLSQVEADISSLTTAVIGFVLFNAGASPIVTLGSGIVLGSVAREKAGSAAALSETSAEFGFALGIASLGSVGTAIYRGQMAGAVPGEVPGAAADLARDTLAGAVAAAQGASGELGLALLSVARRAFVESMQVAAAICAVVMLCVAGLAVTLLWRVRRLGAAEPEPARPLDASAAPAAPLEAFPR